MAPNRYLIIIVLFFSAVGARCQSYTGNFSSYSTSGNDITLHAGSSAIRFVLYRPNLVRVDYFPVEGSSQFRSIVVIGKMESHVACRITNDDSTFSIITDSIRIVCRKRPLRVSFFNGSSEPLLKEPAAGGISTDHSNTTARFLIRKGEGFYGTGERGMSLDLRGLAFDSYNEQHGGYPVGGIPPTMNVNIPFIISTNHYGIYFDDNYKGHFDIGHSDPNELQYTAYGGSLSYFFIYSPTAPGILADYTWLTGRPPLLPKWAYGYIQSKFGYRNDADAGRMIQRMRRDSIPCDAIVLDLYWFRRMGDLSWDSTSWPSPSRITAQFLSQGFKTIVITEPYITYGSVNFSHADSAGYFAMDSLDHSYITDNWWSCNCKAGLLDITNPAARKWWWGKYDSIFRTGVSGLWTDLGEPERDYPDMHFYSGPDAEVHNVYDFLWARTLFDGFNRSFPNRRMFNLTRSGYAGIQRFGVVTWSGDVAKTFGGLAVQVPILLNMGMSGITYHNSDIGGFDNGKTTPELYTRWMEFGAFCPVMRAHGYDGDNPTEPWGFGTSTETIVRKIIRLRYSLLPYNYTMAQESYETGIPMARPLVLEYPNDQNVKNETSAYMWGSEFLVAPIVRSGQTEKTFYLPAGNWVNFWNDRLYKGGKDITVPAPIDETPLFVKSGSIIPMQQRTEFISGCPADTIVLRVYPEYSARSRFDLYDDDGTTLDYQRGEYSITRLEAGTTGNAKIKNIRISIGASTGRYHGKPGHRFYICEIHRIYSRPEHLRVESPARPSEQAAYATQSYIPAFRYEGVQNILYVEVPAACDSSYAVSINGVNVRGR